MRPDIDQTLLAHRQTIDPVWIDYTNLGQVITVASAMSRQDNPIVVVKHQDRRNYNITFKNRTDLYKPEEVVWPV